MFDKSPCSKSAQAKRRTHSSRYESVKLKPLRFKSYIGPSRRGLPSFYDCSVFDHNALSEMLAKPLSLTKADFRTCHQLYARKLGSLTDFKGDWFKLPTFADKLEALGYRCVPKESEFELMPDGWRYTSPWSYSEIPLMRRAIEEWTIEDIDLAIKQLEDFLVSTPEIVPYGSGGYTRLIRDDLINRKPLHAARLGADRHDKLVTLLTLALNLFVKAG